MIDATELVRQAEELAKISTTWADLSNALYDPLEGLLAKALPTREDRYRFIRTKEFQEIQNILARAMERHGLAAGANPLNLTEFMVQLGSSPFSSTSQSASAT